MQAIVRVAIGVLGVLVLAGYLGALHPSLDSLALFRVPLSALMALCALLPFAPSLWRLGAGLAALLTFGFWLLPVLNQSQGTPQITLFQKNLWYGNTQIEDLAEQILEADMDVVTLQEISQGNRQILDLLSKSYPHQHICQFDHRSGVGVLSKLPPTNAQPECSDRKAFAALQIEGSAGPVWIVAVHLPWPYPRQQLPRVRANEDLLTSLEGPKVMVGDFNNLSWAHSVTRMARATGTRVVGPLGPTLRINAATLLERGFYPGSVKAPGESLKERLTQVGLRIDMVLAQTGRVTRLGLTGSDHKSLVAEVNYK
ncbi:MAG: endonuclease/exonuclease/phosphatase family protein [Pseudomonadota bacterium]